MKLRDEIIYWAGFCRGYESVRGHECGDRSVKMAEALERVETDKDCLRFYLHFCIFGYGNEWPNETPMRERWHLLRRRAAGTDHGVGIRYKDLIAAVNSQQTHIKLP